MFLVNGSAQSGSAQSKGPAERPRAKASVDRILAVLVGNERPELNSTSKRQLVDEPFRSSLEHALAAIEESRAR
jgi:hypothetical protein